MVGSFVGFEADCREISQSVFRLHILANSDSQEDQDLKLKVRDRILQDTQGLFESTGDLQQTEEQVAQHLPEIREIALDEIHKQGYSYDVQIYMVNMWFETRTYDTITLPAGNYDALRIVIGNGEGHNLSLIHIFCHNCFIGHRVQHNDNSLSTSVICVIPG